MVKRLLIVSSRQLCYFSAGFFADRMQESLEREGCTVDRLDIDPDNDDYSALESIRAGSFDAIIDINSKLPYMIDDNGDFWLDSLKTPFFNYILDHPLYHHPGLVFKLSDYHAIGIDKNHCRLMEEWYPHLKSVSLLPVAGTEAVSPVPFKKRSVDCLFSGTYIPQSTINREINELCRRFGNEYKDVVDELLDIWDPSTETLEDCLYSRLRTKALWTDDFAVLMNSLYPVDRIKRNNIREQILLAISEEMPLTVMGEGWEYSTLSERKNVVLLPAHYYANSIERLAAAKTVIDITPAFGAGIHDRASCAFANRSLCVSNMSPDYDTSLRDGRELILFESGDMDALIGRLQSFSDSQKEDIANAGYDYYTKNLTWKIHARNLINIIK